MTNFDIEAYLDGALAPAERAAFEAEMAGNPTFAQEVRLMQQLSGDLQTQLLREHVTQALHNGDSNGNKHTRFWFGGLALLLLICTAGYFFGLPNKYIPTTIETPPAGQPSRLETPPQTEPGDQNVPPQNSDGNKSNAPRQPMAMNTPMPNPRFPSPNIRGGGDQDTALAALLDRVWYMDFPPPGTRFSAPYDAVGHSLEARDFSGAYVRLQLLERANPANDTLRFMKGYCLLELGQGREALRYFDPSTGGGNWAAYRQWYRALALLSAGRRDDAITVMKTIRDSARHPFQRQGAKALELMK